MFLIYVNELIDIHEKFVVKVAVFADDARPDDTDVASLQQAVGVSIDWANR